MTAGRALAGAALVVAVAVVAVLLLRGDEPATYSVLFQNAGQLVKDDDVQVGGRRIGAVEGIELTDDNQARITISVEDDFAPLHQGTRAVIRATSLSGIANRYIALTPGPSNAPELEDGAQLTADRTTSIVDLDQLFNTLDPEARKDLQDVVKGFATQLDGAAPQANEAARYFNPALSTSSRLVNELVRDQGAFTDFVVSSSKVVTALAERRDDLSALVGNANETATAVAAEDQALDQSLQVLPGTLRRANTTFVNLRSTLGDLDVLVAESKPATRRLAPFLRVLRPLVADARPTIASLRKLVRTPGSGNDLTDLLNKAPGLYRTAKPALESTTTALRKSTPVLDFARPYTPDLVGWFRDFGQGASNYDANGHYARIQPIFNTFSFANNALTPQPRELRGAGFTTGFLNKCPGTASQAPADGSAPFLDDDSSKVDCDTSEVLPGP